MNHSNSSKSVGRFAIVGTGHRSSMFMNALLNDYKDIGELVAFCDTNPLRMQYWKKHYEGKSEGIATYPAHEFETMILKEEVDSVIVTTIDRTHHDYICRAMRAGCDVISEKPMTIDAEKCDVILEAIAETGRSLRVTFNYRYAPRNSKVKEVIRSGVLGNVLSVHFEWFLDTKHGADYFRRWHRDKQNSGGLMVHKSTHHFDLVNWWIDSFPEEVCAMGALRFYGKENAEKRGVSEFYYRGSAGGAADDDPFALDLKNDSTLKGLYYEAEKADGYHRDLSVFSSGISIEDDVGVLVRYRNRAVMTYHLNAYAPKEGYRVVFNGTKGRLELDVLERAYVSGAADDHNRARNVSGDSKSQVEEPTKLVFQPLWGEAEEIAIEALNTGGHGGGDRRMLDDIFRPSGEDPLGRAAGYRDGAYSILTGVAANRSMATGRTVKVSELLENEI